MFTWVFEKSLHLSSSSRVQFEQWLCSWPNWTLNQFLWVQILGLMARSPAISLMIHTPKWWWDSHYQQSTILPLAEAVTAGVYCPPPFTFQWSCSLQVWTDQLRADRRRAVFKNTNKNCLVLPNGSFLLNLHTYPFWFLKCVHSICLPITFGIERKIRLYLKRQQLARVLSCLTTGFCMWMHVCTYTCVKV